MASLPWHLRFPEEKLSGRFIPLLHDLQDRGDASIVENCVGYMRLEIDVLYSTQHSCLTPINFSFKRFIEGPGFTRSNTVRLR